MLLSTQLASLYASFSLNSPLGDEYQEIRSLPWLEKGREVAFIFKSKDLVNSKDRPSQFQPKKLDMSFNLRFSSPLFKGPAIRLLKVPLFIHLSKQRDKELFLLAIHLEPFRKVASPFLRPAHVVEQVGRVTELLGLPRYLLDKILTQSEDLFVWNLQFGLARRAVFFRLAAWIPILLSFFAFVTLF